MTSTPDGAGVERSVPSTVANTNGGIETTSIVVVSPTTGSVRTVLAPAARPLVVASTTRTPLPAAVAAASSWSPSPLAPIGKVFVGLLLSVGGMNTSNPKPANGFQQFLYSLAKSINDILDPAPEPGTPVVGIPDIYTGVVTGSLGFPAGNGLTFTSTQPATGTVVVGSDGTFTYTPTLAARQAAGLSTVNDFTATVHEGLSSSTVSVTVPVDPGTPVAGALTVGTPDSSTGVVTGLALFTDTVGRSVTYSAPTTSTAGGTVIINPTTGAFTYTPSLAARNASATTGANIDTFTVTANNGIRNATETVAVTIVPSATYVTINLVWDPDSSAHWPSDVRSALQSAANYLASYFVVSSSVTVTVGFTNYSGGTYGVYAQPASSCTSSGCEPVARTKILTGVDINGADAEGSINFNYFPELIGGGANKGSLQAVTMHELMHILGWGTSATYSSFLTDINGNHVAAGDSTFNANLTGANGGLYFGGPNAVAANGGLVKLYTPDPYAPGSSVAHLDGLLNDPVPRLMNPNPGNPPARVLTPTELGVLKDLGYSVVPQPALAGFLILNLGLLGRKRSRSRVVLGAASDTRH